MQLELDKNVLHKVHTRDIEKILKGKNKILMILDGYDEYTKGTNENIDNLIESTTNEYFLLLTSRFGDYLKKKVRRQMDGEIEIKGFSKENIKECSCRYLGSRRSSRRFMRQAEHSKIYELLHIPIVLLMSCIVFKENGSLPDTQTELFGTARQIIIDRTTLKTFGKKSSALENLESWLDELDEMSWEALQSNDRQLLLDKVTCSKISK